MSQLAPMNLCARRRRRVATTHAKGRSLARENRKSRRQAKNRSDDGWNLQTEIVTRVECHPKYVTGRQCHPAAIRTTPRGRRLGCQMASYQRISCPTNRKWFARLRVTASFDFDFDFQMLTARSSIRLTSDSPQSRGSKCLWDVVSQLQ